MSSIRVFGCRGSVRDGDIRVVGKPCPKLLKMLRIRGLRFGICTCTRRLQGEEKIFLVTVVFVFVTIFCNGIVIVVEIDKS